MTKKTVIIRLVAAFAVSLALCLAIRFITPSGWPVATAISTAFMAVSFVLMLLLERKAGDPAASAPRKPFVIWFTGLSGSGKSTLADKVFDELKTQGYPVEKLDGDVVRSIFPKTGFDMESRNQHIRRVGFLASMLEKNNIIVVASFISPYQESRDFVRGICKNFLEVYLSTSVEDCEKRDVKGLYKKARSGEIRNFTGIDDPYEPPKNPELQINTAVVSVEQSVAKIRELISPYLG